MSELKGLFRSRDFWIVVAVMVFAASTGFFSDFSGSTAATAYLEIDYGSKRRAFRGDLPYDMTILDALNASGRAGNFAVLYVVEDDRTDIVGINGVKEMFDNGQKWNFYLNGRKVETDKLHKTGIRAGDKVLVKLE